MQQYGLSQNVPPVPNYIPIGGIWGSRKDCDKLRLRAGFSYRRNYMLLLVSSAYCSLPWQHCWR